MLLKPKETSSFFLFANDTFHLPKASRHWEGSNLGHFKSFYFAEVFSPRKHKLGNSSQWWGVEGVRFTCSHWQVPCLWAGTVSYSLSGNHQSKCSLRTGDPGVA